MRKIFTSIFISLFFLWAQSFAGSIPDPGQIKCYSNSKELPECPQPEEQFYGQDAQYITTPQSYTKLSSKGFPLPDSAKSWVMVRDNLTGLIWEVKNSRDGAADYSNHQDADNTYTWYNSNTDSNGGFEGTPGEGTDTEDFINGLNDKKFGGLVDWRLPTAKELSTIVNRVTESPPVDSASYFPNTVDEYWTSTTDPTPGYSNQCATVSFTTGWMNFPDKSQYMYVRAVHGEESFPSFVDNGDGTVTDINTGLMWQQDGSKRIIWKDALAYCESLTLAEYDDWRLPDINELLSIADYSKPLPAIDTNFFPLTLIYYWSSTTNAQIPDESFQLCFGVRGRVEAHSKEKLGTSYVRAVRGGLYVPSGGDTCPAVVLLGKNDPRLETIRRFRDELLAKSAYGRKLIGFYYKNEKRLISVLEKNRIIKTTAKSVLETIVPAMKWLLN